VLVCTCLCVHVCAMHVFETTECCVLVCTCLGVYLQYTLLWQRLLGSGAQVADPEKADWFFIPVSAIGGGGEWNAFFLNKQGTVALWPSPLILIPMKVLLPASEPERCTEGVGCACCRTLLYNACAVSHGVAAASLLALSLALTSGRACLRMCWATIPPLLPALSKPVD